jgi:hypothetical protein
MHAVIDAKSVFDIAANARQAKPTEEHLTVHVLKLREFLHRRILERLWWCDTRDMIADGLTKGAVERTAILALMEEGRWTLVHAPHAFPKVARA